MKNKLFYTILGVLIGILLIPLLTFATSNIAERLKGKILLQVESKGEAWYVNPDNQLRYYLGRPTDAFNIMRELGLGVSNKDFDSFNSEAPSRLAGKILLKVESKGEAYYVNPVDLKMHYLGRPADAFKVMRELGLGITNLDLNQIIPFGKTVDVSNDSDSDGWNDDFEELYGTDKNNSDTDGDYVPDSIDEHPLDRSSIINKIYKVDDIASERTYSIRVNVPLDLYFMYKQQLTHKLDNYAENVDDYVMYTDPVLQEIVMQVIRAAHDYSASYYNLFRNLVDQVVYNSDAFTGYDEYPKYPIETLVDGSGDCEDTSILLAVLLKGLRWRVQQVPATEHIAADDKVALLVLPNVSHVAVGYYTPELEKIMNQYTDRLNIIFYTHNNIKYYYTETTSNEYFISELPDQFIGKDTSAYVYPIN